MNIGTKIIFYNSKVCSPQVFLIRSKKVVSKFRTREWKKVRECLIIIFYWIVLLLLLASHMGNLKIKHFFFLSHSISERRKRSLSTSLEKSRKLDFVSYRVYPWFWRNHGERSTILRSLLTIYLWIIFSGTSTAATKLA